MPDERTPNNGEMGYYFALAQVSIEMVTPLFVGLAVDYLIGTLPWLTISGLVVGFVGGMVHLVTMANRHEASRKGQDKKQGSALEAAILEFVRWLCDGVGRLAVPAFLLGGEAGLLHTATAAALCYIPTAATLLWCDLALGKSPEQQLAAVMGGTAIRMVFVGASGMALFFLVPDYHSAAFWIWLIVFYLTTLTLEVVLILRRQAAMDRASGIQPPPL